MNESKRERIAARAYEIWEREGRPANKETEHWQRAEQEVAREEASRQMGGGSRAAATPDVPLEAAPRLGDASTRADVAPEDSAQKRTRKKPTRSRRKATDPQQD